MAVPVEVTGSEAPLPTTIDEGNVDKEGEELERIPGLAAICVEAPESKYQSCCGGGVTLMVLKF